MLSSIHPLGERAKGNRWGLTATAFIVGSVAGGLVVGGFAGLAGWGIRALAEPSASLGAVLVAVVVATALVFDLPAFAGRLPTVRRQVDQTWLNRYRGWVYGIGYGFQLGLGIVTIVSTATVYAALVLALLSGSVGGGLAVGGAFGLVRGLVILPGARVTTPDALRALHRRLASGGRVAARLTPVALALMLVAVLIPAVVG